MVKKGDLFNQLAIISDLLEKCNLETVSETIIFEVSKEEFDRVYKMVQSKVRGVQDNQENTFNIKIGNVNMVFNKSNA
jgi:CRP-like cAMP-binding protein